MFGDFYMNIKIFQSCLEKVESWATSLPAQGKSYLHMQNFDMCAARAL